MFNPFRKSSRHRRESAIGTAILGGLMVLAAIPTLFFNEGRAVKTARSLAEGANAVVSVDAEALNQLNDAKLVHLSGLASTSETLRDDRFGVTVNAIRLVRKVEMFQWQELEETVTRRVDGKSKTETEYAYDKVWDGKHHSSNSFREPNGHQNPAALRFHSKEIEAEQVSVGQFQLPRELATQLTDAEPMDVDLSAVPNEIAHGIRADGGTETSAAGFYWSDNPEMAEPQVGDVRIRFWVVRPTTVSVIAQQSGDSLQPFRTHNDREISMIRAGDITAEMMFADAQSQSTAITWALRFAGAIGLIVGIGFVVRPLTAITERIPVVGNLVGLGAAFIAIVLGGAVAILTISFAWLLYRPLIAIPMIAVGVGILVLLTRLSKRQPIEHEPQGSLESV
ncbi:MAG: TMEM43 family protein [Fuerstiella sp.]